MSHGESPIKAHSLLLVEEESENNLPRCKTRNLSTISHVLRSPRGTRKNVAFDPVKWQKLSKSFRREMLEQICLRLEAAITLSHDDMLCVRGLMDTPYSNYQSSFDILRKSLLSLLSSNFCFTVTFTNVILSCPLIERLSERIEKDFLNVVAEALIVTATNAADGIDQAQYHFTEGSTLEQHTFVKAISQFTKHHYILGRFEAIRVMLENLRIQMSTVHTFDLHTVYVPFLQQLISLMLGWGVPLTEETYSLFFKSVLQEYFMRFVGPVPGDIGSEEYENWTYQLKMAWMTLRPFDGAYLSEILGSWYDSDVIPRMKALKVLSED